MLSSAVGVNNAPIQLCCNTSTFLIKVGSSHAQRITRDAVERRFGKPVAEAVAAIPCTWIAIEDEPQADQTPAESIVEDGAMVDAAEKLLTLLATKPFTDLAEQRAAATVARDLFEKLLRKFTIWLSPSSAWDASAWTFWRGSNPAHLLRDTVGLPGLNEIPAVQPIASRCVPVNVGGMPRGAAASPSAHG